MSSRVALILFRRLTYCICIKKSVEIQCFPATSCTIMCVCVQYFWKYCCRAKTFFLRQTGNKTSILTAFILQNVSANRERVNSDAAVQSFKHSEKVFIYDLNSQICVIVQRSQTYYCRVPSARLVL